MQVTVNSNRVAVVKAPVMTGPQGPQGPAGDERTLALASMSITSQQLTTISTQNSWTKILGTTALSANTNDFTMPQNNRLVSGLAESGIAFINGALSFTSSVDNQLFAFAIALDGTVVTNSIVRKKIVSGPDLEQVALVGDLQIAPGQTLEVWVRNESGSNDVTVSDMYFGVKVHKPFS